MGLISYIMVVAIKDQYHDMSRTKHHRHQKHNKWGYDFGARYNCDKCFHNGTGFFSKLLANRERRNESKRIILSEV